MNNRVLTFGVLPVCGAVVGWLLRDRVHILGDGLTLSGMLAIDRLFHGFDLMTYHLAARLRQLIGGGDETGRHADLRRCELGVRRRMGGDRPAGSPATYPAQLPAVCSCTAC